MEKIERGGMLFLPKEDGTWVVIDLNYALEVGKLKLVEGPGWILELTTRFLDWGQITTLDTFFLELNRETKEKTDGS